MKRIQHVTIALLAICIVAAPIGATTAPDLVDVEAPASVDHGDTLRILVTLSNTGDFKESTTITVRSNRSADTWTESVGLLPNQTDRALIRIDTETLDPGYHEFRVSSGGQSRTVTVSIGTPPKQDRRRVRSLTLSAGQSHAVQIHSSMDGSLVLEGNVSDGMTVATGDVTNGSIFSRQSTASGPVVILYDTTEPTLNLSITPSQDVVGEVVPLVWEWTGTSGNETTVLMISVEESQPDPESLDPYRSDGRVTTAGLIQAIDDWTAGAITTETIQRAIAEWADA